MQLTDQINGAPTGTGSGFNPPALLAQNTQLLGNPPINGGGGQFNPDMFNSTTMGNNPQVTAMLKALKGGGL